MSVPDRKLIDGRAHINRAEVERRTGLAEQSQANLYAQRRDNGHPEGVRVGRGLYFDEEQVMAWHRAWAQAKRATLTEVDRSGEPDELVDTATATRILGFTSTSTIRGFLSRNEGYFPEPDDIEDLPSGRIRRRWKRATLWQFADRRSRPGRAGVHAQRIPIDHQ